MSTYQPNDLQDLLANRAYTGDEQWHDPEMIAKLRASGALSINPTTNNWNFNLQKAQQAGYYNDVQRQQVANNSFGPWGPMRWAGDPNGGGDVTYRDPSKVTQTKYGWITPQNNRMEPQDKGFLGALPKVMEPLIMAGLAAGAGYVGAGAMGPLFGGGGFGSNIGSALGKFGASELTSGGKANPLSFIGSLAGGMVPGLGDFGSGLSHIAPFIGPAWAGANMIRSLNRRGG